MVTMLLNILGDLILNKLYLINKIRIGGIELDLVVLDNGTQ